MIKKYTGYQTVTIKQTGNFNDLVHGIIWWTEEFSE